VVGVGTRHVGELTAILVDPEEDRIPALLKDGLRGGLAVMCVSRSCPRYRKSPSGPVAELADGWSATATPQSNVLGCSTAPSEAA
jgi:hypothetical protein